MRFGCSLLCLFAVAAASYAQNGSPLDVTRFGLVYQIPEMKKVQVKPNLTFKGNLKADFYYPAGHKSGQKLPVVVFVNGVGSSGENGLKDWEIYRDWGRLAAAKGFLGVNYESTQEATLADLGDMVKFLQSEKGKALDADGSRIGLWACSANVGTGLPYLMGQAPEGVKCGVIYYGARGFERLRQDVPILYVKAELDGNFGIDDIWNRAIRERAPWTLVLAKGLPHAFDGLDNSDASRALVAQTMEFLASHLQPLPQPVPDSEARQILAYFYGQQPEKAVPLLEKMLASNPKDRMVRTRLLDGYERSNQFEKGIAMGGELVREFPDDGEVHMALGRIYFKQKRYADSAASTKRAIDLGFDNPVARNGLGICYLFMNDTDKALEALKPFEARNIPYALGHYNLACAYARKGQKEKAIAALGKARELGYNAWRGVELDEDFSTLRDEAGYKALIDRMKAANPGG